MITITKIDNRITVGTFVIMRQSNNFIILDNTAYISIYKLNLDFGFK